MREWSKDWRYCRKCLSTSNPHASEGYCVKCLEEIIAERRPKPRTRNCLTCNQKFISDWEGNRRCDDCLRRERENNYLDKNIHKVRTSQDH
jgi:hypothetical protein